MIIKEEQIKQMKEEMKEDNNRKKEKSDNLCDNEKERLRKYEKKGKKVMRDGLDDETRNI